MRAKTDITIVLDRSGSMQDIAADTIGGFNKFIQDQQALPGDCGLSLVQFNHNVHTVMTDVPIRDVALLTASSFHPAGNTALLDAIGRAVTETGYRLAALPERLRPNQVLFVIITDGEENASRGWTRERIFELIAHQQQDFNWKFLFLAANQDAIRVGAHYGFAAANSMTYGADKVGTASSFGSMSHTASVYRSQGVVPDFTDEERVSAAGTTGPRKSDWTASTHTPPVSNVTVTNPFETSAPHPTSNAA